MKSIAGVLVEPRLVKQIYYLIENFFNVMPNNILYIFCGKNHKIIHNNILKTNRNFDKINIIELDVINLDFASYSDLFKSYYIINHIKEDYILTIQTDGCLCEKSTYSINDFLKYDYIGGYAREGWWWKETHGLHNINDFQCFNGGFSLRNKNAMIKVIDTFKPKKTCSFYKGCDFCSFPEDLYFTVGMLKLNYVVGVDKFATNFCTHTSYVSNTFCVHKYKHYEKNSDCLNNFLNYSPEYRRFLCLENI